jgi:superfamily II helicase
MFGYFNFLKKRCNHCDSTNLNKKIERISGHASIVIQTTFYCVNCGAESIKRKIYKRNEPLSNEHKDCK